MRKARSFEAPPTAGLLRHAVKASEGTPAVPFALKDTTGALHRLDDYAAKWLLLIFHRHLR